MARAFPTAEGFGAQAVGGRGGAVYEVTSLADTNTPGTLRYAIEQSGPRTVVFRVDGTINLQSVLNIYNPYITLAFQTAPGQGIQIKNYSFIVHTYEVIMRFGRWRCGLDAIDPQVGEDTNFGIIGMGIRADAVAGSKILSNVSVNTVAFLAGQQLMSFSGSVPAGTTIQTINSATQMTMNNASTVTGRITLYPRHADGTPFVKNVIIDHCDFQWSTDQNMDAYFHFTDVTYQWCISAEGLNVGHSITLFSNGTQQKGPSISHSCGGLHAAEPYGGYPMRITTHHCLFAQNGDRNPLINTYTGMQSGGQLMQYELINNVIYDWRSDGGPWWFGCAFYDISEYNAFKTAVNWPNGVVPVQVNIIGNTMRNGPSNIENSGVGWAAEFARLFLRDNVWHRFDGSQLGPLDGFQINVNRDNPAGVDIGAWIKWVTGYTPGPLERTGTPWPFTVPYPVTIAASEPNYDTVLDNVGPAFVWRNGVKTSIRDAVDTRIINEVRTKTGQSGGSFTYQQWLAGQNLAYPTLGAGTPPVDTDHDGIPDSWAVAHGLSPTGNPGPVMTPNGYTNLENYLNELAGDTVGTLPPPPPADTTPPAVPVGVMVV